MKKELEKKDGIKIKCPLCKKKIPSSALKCSKCTGDLSTTKVQEDIQSQLQERAKIQKITWIIVGFLVIIIIVSSGGEDTPTTPNTKTLSNCLEVSPKTVEWIESGFIEKNNKLLNVKAIKSDDFEKVYFISAYIKGSENIVTLSMNSITGTGLTLSVNERAKIDFEWFHGDREGAQFHITMQDHGAKESQKCL